MQVEKLKPADNTEILSAGFLLLLNEIFC